MNRLERSAERLVIATLLDEVEFASPVEAAIYLDVLVKRATRWRDREAPAFTLTVMQTPGRRCSKCGALGCGCQGGDENGPGTDGETSPLPPSKGEELHDGEGSNGRRDACPPVEVAAPASEDSRIPTDAELAEGLRERPVRRRECPVCNELKGFRAFDHGEYICRVCKSRNTPERTLEGAYYSPNEDGFNLFAKEHSLNFSSAVERRRRMAEWIQGQKAAMGAA